MNRLVLPMQTVDVNSTAIDRARYEIVANHYRLTIERAIKGELIFKELKDGI